MKKTFLRALLYAAVPIALVLLLNLLFVEARPRVEVVTPQLREVAEVLIATGRLRVRPVSELAVDAAGIVAEVNVREGDRVEAGAPLVTLRQQEARGQVEQARAGVETARRELARLERGALPEELAAARAELERTRTVLELAGSDLRRLEALAPVYATGADVERARAALEQARAAHASAQANLEGLESQPRREELAVARARVSEARAALELARQGVERRELLAPFAGLVLRRQVESGEAVAPGQALITLANMEQAEVYVETDENNLARLRQGDRAVVIPMARPAERFEATVSQIGPEVDPQRGVVAVRLTPERLPETIYPEMTVDVNIEIARFEAAPSLPRSAVVDRIVETDEARVYVVDGEGVVHPRTVGVLARGATWIAVSGVESGERVVLDPSNVEGVELTGSGQASGGGDREPVRVIAREVDYGFLRL